MKNFLVGIVVLFVLSLFFMGAGYLFGLLLSVMPGFSTILTGVPYLSPEMLPTIFAWLTFISVAGYLLIFSALHGGDVNGGDE